MCNCWWMRGCKKFVQGVTEFVCIQMRVIVIVYCTRLIVHILSFFPSVYFSSALHLLGGWGGRYSSCVKYCVFSLSSLFLFYPSLCMWLCVLTIVALRASTVVDNS